MFLAYSKVNIREIISKEINVTLGRLKLHGQL